MPTSSPNFLTCPIEPPPEPASSSDSSMPPPEHLPSTPSVEPHRLSWVRRHWPWVVGIGMLFAVVSPLVIFAIRAGRGAYSARQSLVQAEHQLRNLNISDAQQSLADAQDSLEETRAILHSAGVLRNIPGIGTNIRALEDAIGAGAGTLDGAGDMLGVVAVVIDALKEGAEARGTLSFGIDPRRSYSELTREEKRDVLQTFFNELPRLRAARDKIDLALELWKRVPQDDLFSPLRQALRPMAEELPRVKQALDQAVPLLEAIVPMAGYPEPRAYVIALQNASEIRPAGGFIGTVGTMTWDAGELANFAFTDVYNIDNPVSGVWKETPPKPLQTYLGVPQWFLRDANWSPDFPTSAERVLDFYIRETELQAHANLPHPPTTFLAFEPGFFRALLSLTGPIMIDGQRYDAENFFETLEFQVEVGWHQQGIPVEKRKEIISRIGNEMATRLFALPASRWPDVLNLVTAALEQKQIMAYSRDPDLLRVFDDRGWTARTKPSTGDFLWVVDANLAALKTDAAMQKSMTYRLQTDAPGGPTATVTLTYANTAKGFQDYRFTRYRSYTRVYVPEGSELLSSDGAMQNDLNKTGGRRIPGTVDAMKDLGKTVFGAFWSIEPGKTGSLSFTYRLPSSVAAQIRSGTYHLDWMKQPGVDDAKLTVDLAFGKNIMGASPPEPKEEWGDGQYRIKTDSRTDRLFTVTF